MSKNSYIAEMARGAGITLIFSVVGYLVVFLFKLIAVRHFGSELFGLYVLSETILGILMTVVTLGIIEGVVRFVPKYVNSRHLKSYLSFSFFIPLMFSVIVSGILILVRKNIVDFFNYPAEFSLFILVLGVIIPLRVIQKYFRSVLLANKKIVVNQTSINIFEKGIPLVLLPVFIYYNLPIIWLLLAILFSTVFNIFYCGFFILKYRFLKFNFQKKNFKTSSWLKFSIPLLFSSIFAFLISWSDNLIIGKFLDPSSLAIYSIVYSFASSLIFIRSSFVPLFIPIASDFSNNKKKLSSFTYKLSSWIFISTLPLTLFLIFFSKKILDLFYGSEFQSGAMSLSIIAFGFLIYATFGLQKEVLILKEKTSTIFITNIIISCFNILLNLILIPLYGIFGAAISSSLSLILLSVIFFVILDKKYLIFSSFSNFFKIFLSAIIALFPLIIIISLGINVYVKTLLLLGLYFVMYFLLLILFKVFDETDRFLFEKIEEKIGFKLKPLHKLINLIHRIKKNN